MPARTLTELAADYGDFYVPAYDLKLGARGEDPVSKHGLEVASVQVDSTLEGADRFQVVVNAPWDIEHRDLTNDSKEIRSFLDLFAPGTQVAIAMGYADKRETVFSGVLTAVRTSFPSGGVPQVTLSGYDHSYWMLKGTGSKSWPEKTDAFVAREVTQPYGLKAEVEETSVVHRRIDKNQESDWSLLQRLATRNGYELFVREKTLYFRTPSYKKDGDVRLEWGAGLVSFTPTLDIGSQVTEVEVYGWDLRTKKEIVGRARRGDEPGRDPKAKSGADRIQNVKVGEVKLRVREPVFSLAQADKRAQAILKAHAEDLVTGTAESIGLPQILPDSNVEIKGVGEFSKTYYVRQATHTISSGGYTTSFQVKEPTL